MSGKKDTAYREIIEYTVKELVKRINPDLITITGDVAWAEHYTSYENFASLMDSTGIKWAYVWGNHDHQCGIKSLQKAQELMSKHPLCLFDVGDKIYGNGNYILSVREEETPICALFMIDSHNSTYIKVNNENKWAYDKLWPEQIEWIGKQAIKLKIAGYKNAALFLHIPPYCYKKASEKTFPKGYGESEYGSQNEPVFSHPCEDGVLSMVRESGLITHILAGHDHTNNWMIDYEGVKLMFAAKTGAGGYWQEKLNGGTVIKINENGIYDAYHEFVNVSHFTIGKNIPGI